MCVIVQNLFYRFIVRGWTNYFYRYLSYKEGNFIHTGICCTSLSCKFYIITFKAKHRCIIPCRSLADLGERFAKYIPKTRIALWRGNILLQKIMYFVKLWPISSGHLKEPDLKYICTCIGHQTNRRTNLIQTHEPSMSSLLPPFIIEIHVHKCLSYVTWKSRFAIWLSCIIICNKI